MYYVRFFLKLENVIGVKNVNPLSKVIGLVGLKMEQKIGLYAKSVIFNTMSFSI